MSAFEPEAAVAAVDPWTVGTHAPAEVTVDSTFTELSNDVVNAIVAVMETDKVTRSQLAKELGTSVANITQCIRPGTNMTLKTINRMLFTMGYKLDVQAVKL